MTTENLSPDVLEKIEAHAHAVRDYMTPLYDMPRSMQSALLEITLNEMRLLVADVLAMMQKVKQEDGA